MFLMNVDEITRLAIAWGPTVVFLLILLGGTIWGFIRGFRKSTILAIHALIALAICLTGYLLIVTNPDVDSLVVQYINQAMGEGWIQNQMGVSASCAGLKDCLIEFIPKNMDYGEGLLLVLRDNGQYLLSLVNMAYHIIFALVFGIIYLVLILIGYLFIYHIFYPERRYKRKKMKREAKLLDKGNGVAKPYKKRRLLGGFIGATRGLVAGLVCMSFLGALFFVIAGGTGENSETEDNGYDFGDQNINLAHNIYQNVSHYGETGIFKLLNSLKDEDQIPYYLFASELVFQGGSKSAVDENGNNTNIALTRELTAYTSFARKTFDLILANDTNGLVRRIVKNEIPQDDILVELSSIMGKKEFQNDFNKLIDDFNANTYFINLGVSLIDSVAKNLGKFENLGLSEDVLEITNILFNSEHKSEYIPEDKNTTSTAVIKVSDLVTKDDTKALIKTGISVLGLDTKEKDDVQRIIAYTEKVVPSLQNFSILHDDSKAVNFNNLLERVFTYSVNRFIPKEENEEMVNPTALVKLVSEETGTGINWIGEIGKVFDLSLSALKIADNVYVKDMDLEKDYLDLVFNIFDVNHKDHVESEAEFNKIKDALCTSSLLSLVMSETGMYKMLEEKILDIAPEAYFEGDKILYMNPVDKDGNPILDENGHATGGEIYNLLTAVETAMKDSATKDLVKSIMNNDMDPNNMEQVLNMAEQGSAILTKGGKDSVINSLLKSDVVTSVLSGLIISNKEIAPEQNIILYIPDYVKETNASGEAVNIISDEYILSILYQLPDLIGVVKPYLLENIEGEANKDFESVNALIERLGTSDAFDELLKSPIIEGTLVNTMYGLLSENEFIVMPDGYYDEIKYDDDTSTRVVNTEAWIKDHEVRNIVDGIVASNLDIDSIMKPDPDSDKTTTDILLGQISDMSKEEIKETGTKPLTKLLKSNLLHYSISGFLVGDTTEFLGDIKLYITVDDYAEEENENGELVKNEKLIDTNILIDTLVQIPDVLKALDPYINKTDPDKKIPIGDLIANLNKPSSVNKSSSIVDKLLEVSILHGTMVNALFGPLSEVEMISIPKEFKVEKKTTENGVEVVKYEANVKNWIQYEEINHVFKALSDPDGLNIDGIMTPPEGQETKDVLLENLEAMAALESNPASTSKPVTLLLESRVLYNTLSTVLSGQSDLLGDKVKIYAPEFENGDNAYAAEDDPMCGKVIDKEEIINTVIALPTLMNEVMPELEKEDLDLNALINKLSPKEGARPVEKLYDSLILKYTLADQMTKALTDINEGKDPKDQIIKLPSAYLKMLPDNKTRDLRPWFNGHNEIDELLKAVINSEINLNDVQGGNLKVKQTVNNIGNKGAEKIKTEILGSEILSATISNLIQSDNLGISIVVPTKCYSNEAEELIDNTIIANLLAKVPTVLNSMDDKTNEIDNNKLIKDVVLNNKNATNENKLLMDPILMPTIVNYLNDPANNILTNTENISLPNELMTAAKMENLKAYDYTTPSSNPWAAESVSLISALDAIAGISSAEDGKIPDITNTDTLLNGVKNLNEKYDGGKRTNLDVVYTSSIMQATLSMHLDKNLDKSVYDTKVDIGAKDGSIYKVEEISALVEAFNYLEIDIKNPTFDKIRIDSELNAIANKSNIFKMALTVTLTKDDMAGKVLVPNAVMDKKYPFIGNAEVDKLLTALYSQRDNLFPEKDETGKHTKYVITNINLDAVSVNMLETLIDSDILYATAASQIITMSTDPTSGLSQVISLPQEYKDAKDTLVTDYSNNIWPNSQEINKLVNGLGVFVDSKDAPIKDIDASVFTAKIKVLNEKVDPKKEPTNLDNVYDSVIMKATLSSQLDKNLEDICGSIDNIGAKEETGYYKKTEVAALVDAFNYLEIDFNAPSFNEIRIDVDLSTYVTNSQVVKAALSSTLNGNDMKDKIIVPTDIMDKTYKTLISDAEIQDLLKILNDNKSALFGEPSTPGNSELKTHDKYNITAINIENALTISLIRSLTDSAILNATIISNLGTLSGVVVIPTDYALAAADIRNTYYGNIWVKNEEVNKLINGLGVFVESENTPINNIQAESFTGKIKTLNAKPNPDAQETNLQTVYSSIIMKATLTDQLDKNLEGICGPTDNIGAKDGLYYKQTEVAALVDAFNYLEIDFNAPSFTELRIDADLSTYVTNSQVVKAALTSTLTGDSMKDKIIVPITVMDTTYKTLISDAEIQELLRILNDNKSALFGEPSTPGTGKTHDKYNMTAINIQNSLTISLIRSLTGSTILNATTIKNLGALTINGLVIPDRYREDAKLISSYDATNNVWLMKDEIGNLITALGVFIDDKTVINGDNLSADTFKNKINSLLVDNGGRTNLDIAYDSNIIKASMDEPLNNILNSVISNKKVLTHTRVRGVIEFTTNNYYLSSEVAAMINSLKTLGITDLVGFNDASNVKNKVVSLTRNDLANLNESFIVWNILSEQFESVFSGMNVNNVVLEKSKETINGNTPITVYTVDAVDKLFTALRTLVPGMEKLDNVGAQVKKSIFELDDQKLSVVYESHIVVSILTTQLDSVLEVAGINAIVIDGAKKKLYTDNDYKVYVQGEILGLVKAASALGMDNVDGISSMGSNALLGNNVDLATAYSSSNIIKDLITQKLDLVVDDNVLKKHSTAKEKQNMYNPANVYFYTENEVANLIGFMKACNVGKFDGFALPNTLSAEAITCATNSVILNATITSNIINAKAFKITNNVVVKNTTGDLNRLLTKTELSNLLNAMFAIPGVGFGSQDMTGFGPNSITDENIEKLVASEIMRAKITEFIYSATKFMVTNDPKYVEIKELLDSSDRVFVLTGSEIANFIKGVKSLSSANSFEISFDANVIKNLNYKTVYTIMDSNIIGNLLSKTINDLSLSNTPVPLKPNSKLPVINISGRDGNLIEYTLIAKTISAPLPITGYMINTTGKTSSVYQLGKVVGSTMDSMLLENIDVLALIYILNNTAI